MAKHKLSLLIDMPDYEIIEIKSSKGTVGTRLRGNVKYTLCCGETGETVSGVMPNEAIDWDDKAFSKLYTLAQKNILISVFQISTGDETDPDSDGPHEVANQAATRQQPAQSGNGKTKPPTNPAELLAVINRRVDAPYDNVHHLFNAIRQESAMDDYQWPRANDENGWREAYRLGKEHAAKKTADQGQLFDTPATDTTYTE
jgi:hypothetical protein